MKPLISTLLLTGACINASSAFAAPSPDDSRKGIRETLIPETTTVAASQPEHGGAEPQVSTDSTSMQRPASTQSASMTPQPATAPAPVPRASVELFAAVGVGASAAAGEGATVTAVAGLLSGGATLHFRGGRWGFSANAEGWGSADDGALWMLELAVERSFSRPNRLAQPFLSGGISLVYGFIPLPTLGAGMRIPLSATTGVRIESQLKTLLFVNTVDLRGGLYLTF